MKDKAEKAQRDLWMEHFFTGMGQLLEDVHSDFKVLVVGGFIDQTKQGPVANTKTIGVMATPGDAVVLIANELLQMPSALVFEIFSAYFHLRQHYKGPMLFEDIGHAQEVSQDTVEALIRKRMAEIERPQTGG